MKTIRTNAMQFLKENYKANYNPAEQTFREYVELSAQSDPGFYRWLFDNPELQDYQLPENLAEQWEQFLNDCETAITYDVHFNDENDSNSKGFELSYQDCLDYIQANNGTKTSYFADYRGGTVSIVCNEDGETVYEELVK